MVYLLSK